MKNPLVSILIANYNNAEYIADCINSLKRQSYKNIEIIFLFLKKVYSFFKKLKSTEILSYEKK